MMIFVKEGYIIIQVDKNWNGKSSSLKYPKDLYSKAMENLLKDLNVPKKNIKKEDFPGY